MSSKMLSVNGSTGRSGLMNNWFEKTLIDLFGCFYVAPIGGRHQISVNQERWSGVRRLAHQLRVPEHLQYREREDQVFDILQPNQV